MPGLFPSSCAPRAVLARSVAPRTSLANLPNRSLPPAAATGDRSRSVLLFREPSLWLRRPSAASLQREPLGLHAAILVVVGAERFLPATADGFESLCAYTVLLDEQALDLVRALLAEIDGLERHLS